jgi:mutator protein MutT
MSTPRRTGGAQALPRPTQWRELQHSPFDRLDTTALADLSAVRAALAAFSPSPESQQPPPTAQPSAVLVGLFDSSVGPQVLLTRRSENLSSHRGQIAFPGGRLEPGETSLQAALRETREEVGIDVTHVTVLGQLAAHRTISSTSHIVPHVADLGAEPSGFRLSDEVERVFSVPLVDLVRPDTFAQEHWVFTDREVVVPMFYLDDETIWGATARMLQELLLLTLQR